MKATIEHNTKSYQVDLDNGLDISIPLSEKASRAWYVEPIKINPVQGDGFVGSVAQGGSVNFRNISFNPHGNGTHTECVGHITEEVYSVNQHVRSYFVPAVVVSVHPTELSSDNGFQLAGDFVIQKQQLNWDASFQPKAIVIRTLPNGNEKTGKDWSNSNPPYICHKAVEMLVEKGIEHLLIDLPSVDKEVDNGRLLSHHTFWQTNGKTRMHASITEFIYVDDNIPDGNYFLNLQMAPFENDATPSRPVLYPIIK